MLARFMVDENARWPIVLSGLSCANVIVSIPDLRNACRLMEVTVAGISMLARFAVSWNAKPGIVRSWLPGAKVTVSMLEFINAHPPIEVTLAGISMPTRFAMFSNATVPMEVTGFPAWVIGGMIRFILMPLMSTSGATSNPVTEPHWLKVAVYGAHVA